MNEWDKLKKSVEAWMTPEQLLRHKGFQAGHREAHEAWEFEIASSSLWSLLRTRRSIRKRLKHDS